MSNSERVDYGEYYIEPIESGWRAMLKTDPERGERTLGLSIRFPKGELLPWRALKYGDNTSNLLFDGLREYLGLRGINIPVEPEPSYEKLHFAIADIVSGQPVDLDNPELYREDQVFIEGKERDYHQGKDSIFYVGKIASVGTGSPYDPFDKNTFAIYFTEPSYRMECYHVSPTEERVGAIYKNPRHPVITRNPDWNRSVYLLKDEEYKKITERASVLVTP